MRSLILSLSAVLALSSCGVNVDLSSLKFDPEEEEVRAEPDVARQTDTPRQDGAPTDVVVPPEVIVQSGNCWDVYECIIFEEMAWNLNQNKFLKCGATLDDGEYSVPIQGLHDCLDVCMISDTGKEFAACLTANCIDYTLKCMNDGDEGDKSCAEAMACSLGDCSATPDRPNGGGLGCLLECYEGMSNDEVDKLTGVIDECVFKDGETNPACIPAAQLCFAGSGDADEECWDVIMCMQDCEHCGEDGPGRDGECQPETCVIDCFWGMSWDAHDQINGLSLCYSDPYANAFECLEAGLLCFEYNLSGLPGTTTCAQTLQIMKESYYMPEGVPFTDKFEGMLGSFWTLNKNHVLSMHKTLSCLSENWEVFKGYGAMPKAQWAECAQNQECH